MVSKKMPVLAVAILAILTCLSSAPAGAYRTNNSSWNDYNFVWWSGVPNGQVSTSSNNYIRGTSWLTYCNRMSWSGYTYAYAPGATATYLSDYWSASTAGGSISFSVPPSVSVSGGSKSATWANEVGGDYNGHSYSSYPIQFTVGTWFYSINHSVSSSRRVGGTGYNGPSYQRYEWVC